MSRGRVTKPYCNARQTTLVFEPSSEQQLSWHSGGVSSTELPLWFEWAKSITSSPPSKPVASATIGR